jgi:microcystin-dependent protein
MNDPDLSNQYIKDTFDGILHMNGDPLPINGTSKVYDGVGNVSSLSVGRSDSGISVSGTVSADKLYGFTVEANQLKAGNVNYPVSGSVQNLIDLIYPVGSVYFSTVERSPAAFFGGSWARTAEGRFVGGVGTGTDQNGNTRNFGVGNGSGEYQTALSDSTIPSHTHTGYVIGAIDPEFSSKEDFSTPPKKFNVLVNKGVLVSDDTGHDISETSSSTVTADRIKITGSTASYYIGEPILESVGGGNPHNNTPPTFGLFVYTRTA